MKVVSVVCSATQSCSSLGAWGVMFKPERGMNYFLVSNFTCMRCGDLNSADKDCLSEHNFSLLKSLN